MKPANMTSEERVEHVLDEIGGEIDFELEIKGAQSAYDCLCDSTTLEEIRLNLQDMEAAAREILKLVSQSRRILKTAGK
jgi:hypothetical protein